MSEVEVELHFRIVWQMESCEFTRRLSLPFVPGDQITLHEGMPGRGVAYRVQEVFWLLGEARFVVHLEDEVLSETRFVDAATAIAAYRDRGWEAEDDRVRLFAPVVA